VIKRHRDGVGCVETEGLEVGVRESGRPVGTRNCVEEVQSDGSQSANSSEEES
jgi:hypothetical protein